MCAQLYRRGSWAPRPLRIWCLSPGILMDWTNTTWRREPRVCARSWSRRLPTLCSCRRWSNTQIQFSFGTNPLFPVHKSNFYPGDSRDILLYWVQAAWLPLYRGQAGQLLRGHLAQEGKGLPGQEYCGGLPQLQVQYSTVQYSPYLQVQYSTIYINKK